MEKRWCARYRLVNTTNAVSPQIKWPSGTVQEFHNVTANQILTVTEPAKLEPSVTLTNGLVELKVKSWKAFAYGIEASSDLLTWTRLTTPTNLTGTLQFADPDAKNVTRRFYRTRLE